jgi:hypothetical protein
LVDAMTSTHTAHCRHPDIWTYIGV